MAVKIGESGRMEIEGIIKRAEAAIYPYGDIRIATEFTLEGSEQEYVIERDLLRLDKGEKVRITYVSEFFQDDNYGNKPDGPVIERRQVHICDIVADGGGSKFIYFNHALLLGPQKGV
ncbi:hypothetical protein J4419_01835 [Candidatus Woesearchaeota archaeon]|nr:hypothetical protein [Candidatus Woesearchaeota archaeon]